MRFMKCGRHGTTFPASDGCDRLNCDSSDYEKTEPTQPRRVVWFSCGAASAVLAKLTVPKYPDAEVVYCDTSKSEHPDNLRFRRDVEAWIEKDVTVIRSEKYADVDEVFEKRNYMSGPKGAICTTEMKKIPRFHFQRADDIHLFGFTYDEQGRIRNFQERNPDLYLEWTLRDMGITKEECYERLRTAGITLPTMYGLGFKNNNCLGCVKATSPAYWNHTREVFPATFEKRCQQSRRLGVKLVRWKGERIFLDELPKTKPAKITEDISCGPECGQVEA